MENEKHAFFIGNTRVNYDITTSEDNKNCIATYTIYTNDGFGDTNYIKKYRKQNGLGGTPYPFISSVKQYIFENPGNF